MGFVNAVVYWAILAMGLVVPMVAVLEGIALTRLTEHELRRNGVTADERNTMLHMLRRYVALALIGAGTFGIACFVLGPGRGGVALALGVPGVALWRWAAARASERADVARREARAIAASRATEGVGK